MKTMLLNWLVSSSACLVGAWGLTIILRNKSAAWRHLAWGLGFVAVLVCGTLTVMSWRVEVPLLAAVEKSSPAVVRVKAVTISDNFASVSSPPPSSAVPARQVDWWLVIWLSGTAVCLSPLVVGGWRVRKMLARVRSVADSDSAALRDFASSCETKLLLSDAAVVPLTVGMFAPKIVLPSSASAWSAERLRRVLAHEQAHQQRHDLAWALLARVVCALCWFNPLSWFAAHRQRLESERACDDCVINSGAAAADYADDLVQILKDCPRDVLSPLVMTMARHSQIKPRLQSLLAADVQRGAVGRFAALALTVSVLLLAAVLMVVRVGRNTASAPAAASLADNSPASGDVLPKDKEIVVSVRLLKFPLKSRALRSEPFKRAWAAGEVDKIMQLGAAAGAKLVTSAELITRSGQKGVVRCVKEMRFPTEWDFSSKYPEYLVTENRGNPSHFVKEDVGLTVEYLSRILEREIELNLTVRSVTMGNIESPTLDISFNKQEMHLARLVRNGGSFAVWLPWEQEGYGLFKQKDDQPGRYGLIVSAELMEPVPAYAALSEYEKKLKSIVIPKVVFTDTDIAEVLNYLQEQSKLHDPQKEGVNFVFSPFPAKMTDVQRTVTLDLHGVSLLKILDFLESATAYKVKVEEKAVFVAPNAVDEVVMVVRTFTVPENFWTTSVKPVEAAEDSPKILPVAVDVKKELADKGIEFRAGASAAYLPKTKKLVVRNTAEQFDKIAALLAKSASAAARTGVGWKPAVVDKSPADGEKKKE